MRDAALGLRAHSGWAALVAVATKGPAVEVVDRRRVEMADPRRPASKQPYHEAEHLSLDRAAALLERHSQWACQAASRTLADVAEHLRARGFRLVGGGLLVASGRPLPKLEMVLASHALIHAADGEHFRHALAVSCQARSLPLTRISERELPRRAEAALKQPAARLQAAVGGLGRGLGPPWTQDQKLAALAAWVMLARSRVD
jgi:hypothetical protein